MPYRGSEPSGPACARHAAAPAAASCHACGAELCEICIVYSGTEPHCFKCAGRKRRARTFGRALFVAAAVGLAATATVFFVTRKKPFDYGDHKAVIADLRTRALADRCHQQAALDYEDALVTAGDFMGAIDDSDAFFAKCGDWFRLRWVRYTAYQRLREYHAAAAEASRLIAHNPNDHDYWWWRGSVYEQLAEWTRAAADYRQSLVLLPRSDGVPFSLERVYERRGQACRALGPLEQYFYTHPDDSEPTRTRIVMLAGQRGCLRDGRGNVLLHNAEDAHALDHRVKLPGWNWPGQRFLLAPESAYTVMSRSAVERQPVKLDGAEPIQVDVDGELKPARLTTLPSLTVGDARATEVEVAVVDELPDGLDGIIGISFLDRFNVEYDDDTGELSISEWPRAEAP